MRILLAILLVIGLKAEGQIIRAQPFHTSRAVVVTDTLLLDSFPNAAVAYSLRKLRTAYTGNCIRVRRSNDNTEQDIGFVDNFLDTASMKTFVGNNNGFVTTWYDQGDSARDATQTTAARQPRIINSGTIETILNKASLYFTSNIMQFARFNTTAATSFIIYRRTSNINSALFVLRRSSDNYKQYQFAVNSSAGFGPIMVGSKDSSVFWGIGGTVGTNTNRLYTGIWTGAGINGSSNYKAYSNASNITLSNSNNISFGNVNQNSSIGGEVNNSNVLSNTMTGYLSEIIFYDADKTSDRTSIENNINRNWLIY